MALARTTPLFGVLTRTLCALCPRARRLVALLLLGLLPKTDRLFAFRRPLRCPTIARRYRRCRRRLRIGCGRLTLAADCPLFVAQYLRLGGIAPLRVLHADFLAAQVGVHPAEGCVGPAQAIGDGKYLLALRAFALELRTCFGAPGRNLLQLRGALVGGSCR